MKKESVFKKDFTLLWLGQSVSEIGNTAGYLALLWWVTVVSKSAIALGTLAMIKGFVAVFTAPFAGALVDRLNRKYIIVITDFLHCIVFAVLGYLAYTSQLTLPIVYVCGGLSSLIYQMFTPAIASSLPLIVDEDHLAQANSLQQVSSSIVRIAGYAVSGIGIAYFGIPALFFVDSISFLISSISEMFIKIPHITKSTKFPSLKEVTADIKIGFKYVKQNNSLFTLLKSIMFLNIFFVPFMLLLPRFVKFTMGLESDIYGFIMSGQMVGMLIGAVLMSAIAIQKKYPWVIRWSLAFMGIFLLPLPLLPVSLWQLHATAFIIVSIFTMIFNINGITLVQKTTSQEHMGKVFGFMSTLTNGLTPAAQGLTGVLANFVSISLIYLCSAVCIVFAGIKFAYSKVIMSFLLSKPEEKSVASPT